MKKLILAALLAFAPATAPSQPTTRAPASPEPAAPTTNAPAPLPDADPALWVVRDEDTTVYLFGTFHLLDGRPWFNDEVKTAFDASDELVLEATFPENPAELMGLVQRYAVDPQGRKLSDRLPPEEFAELTRALSSLGLPEAAIDRIEPWYASMALASVVGRDLGISAEHSPEILLNRAASARSMPIGELEGFEWQMQLFDRLPEEQQLAQLRQTLDSLENGREVLGPMLAAWSSGDVEGLQRIMDSQEALDPAMRDLLFTSRNRTWAEWIRDRMSRPGTVFLAVGAGHLAGADSVQALLRPHGLAAERVPHVEAPAPAGS